jgi:glycosyltransferase involved in cell wall biosynthesis
MLRILHVISGLRIGGAETALYRLVTGSGAGQCSHAVAALTPDGAMGPRLREAGVELVTFDFKRSPLSHFLGLALFIRRTRPDIVQTWMYHADMFGGLAARLTGNRNVIWGIRTTELQQGDARATVAVRSVCARLSRWIPHTIVCVAEAARRSHVEAGYDAGRMVVVPNGFDLSRLVTAPGQASRLRAQCGFGADELVIGTLGRFNHNKDQRNFVRAAGLLAQRNDHVRFLMAGRGLDPGNAELRHWLGKTGRAERFALLGERADMPVCLEAMDIFCLSSRTEAFPNVVGEAMAMAVPCVVTDVGDAAMLVADTGVVVPKEDSAALADGMARLSLMTPDARRQLGRRAKERIHAEFAMARACARFEAVYQRVIEESKR